MRTLSPIEELMTRKLGKIYERFLFAKKRDEILMKELKKVLINEVKTILERNGMSYPPFDPFRISRIGNAEIRVAYVNRSEIGADGCINVSDRGFLVKIDENLRLRGTHRLRSTMAHELMHTFFYDITKLPPVKLGDSRQSRKHFLMEEELCYYLAREFLMPAFSVSSLMTENLSLKSPSLMNMTRLKSDFDVSSEIIAYRMISDLSLWDAIFVKFIEKGFGYKPERILKNKSNKLYKRILIPKYVPFKSLSVWQSVLSKHITNAAKIGLFEEIINLYEIFDDLPERMLALESRVENKDPLSIITLLYEVVNQRRIQ